MGLRLSAPARREVIQRMAPRYQHVSASFKGVLLDEVVALTGYARRTALRLLNHPPQGPHPKKRHRHRRYGPEVQQVLFLLWHLANRICTKRLIPFLPTLIEALERHHHLHVSETCRHQLLTISAATADRLLRSQRVRGL
ncbi:MAG: ISNCY family transposase, partial [Ktedonobacteraceae bacterium]|nr:ISNCY family transposase [Ktedonobacteraceae bacterium]